MFSFTPPGVVALSSKLATQVRPSSAMKTPAQSLKKPAKVASEGASNQPEKKMGFFSNFGRGGGSDNSDGVKAPKSTVRLSLPTRTAAPPVKPSPRQDAKSEGIFAPIKQQKKKI